MAICSVLSSDHVWLVNLAIGVPYQWSQGIIVGLNGPEVGPSAAPSISSKYINVWRHGRRTANRGSFADRGTCERRVERQSGACKHRLGWSLRISGGADGLSGHSILIISVRTVAPVSTSWRARRDASEKRAGRRPLPGLSVADWGRALGLRKCNSKLLSFNPADPKTSRNPQESSNRWS
jgi:hypothetical protein